MTLPPVAPTAARRGFLDWLRGLAVLIMIEAHTINAWTALSDQKAVGYAWAMIVGGFGAPAFLFLAGIGVVLSAVSRTATLGSRRAAGSRVARRGWEIFGLAFLFRLQSFILNPGSPPASLLKVDILNIMGPAMAAAAWLWTLPRTASGRVVALGMATIATGALTPVVRAWPLLNALPDPIESYLRPLPGRANFVVFPWAAFLFGGALVGLVWSGSANRLGRGSGGQEAERHAEVTKMIALGAAGAALAVGAYLGSYLPSVFTDSSFWTSSPSFFFLRLGILLMVLPVAYFSPRLIQLERLGRSSLFVYWIHVELVYGIATRPLQRRLALGWAFLVFALFTVAMYGVVVLKERIVAGIGGRGSEIGLRASPILPTPHS